MPRILKIRETNNNLLGVRRLTHEGIKKHRLRGNDVYCLNSVPDCDVNLKSFSFRSIILY